jgi:hypothetical protein
MIFCTDWTDTVMHNGHRAFLLGNYLIDGPVYTFSLSDYSPYVICVMLHYCSVL